MGYYFNICKKMGETKCLSCSIIAIKKKIFTPSLKWSKKFRFWQIIMQNPETDFQSLIKTESEKSVINNEDAGDEFDSAFSKFEL